MSIIRNEQCPECHASGHDNTGNHLLTFEDGAKFCSHEEYHKSGKKLYIAPDGSDPIKDAKLDGNTRFTIDQFKTLAAEGRLDNPTVRAITLKGMKNQDAFTVMTEAEQELVRVDWELDSGYFSQLKTKNLISRHIKGQIAKFYNVRVGTDAKGEVTRHYYPRYDEELWVGAKCRTLPKDFKYGALGRLWGKGELFGQHTLQAVLAGGRHMDTLVLKGGECDAMAAQQMLLDAADGTKYAGKFFHIWSVMKGEKCIEEILANKDIIGSFKKIIVGFDDDEVGQALNKDVARLFRGKVKKLVYPPGCKDANACLMKGKHKEYVDAFFNPQEVFGGGKLKRVSEIAERAKVTPIMGLSWPWPEMNKLTYGIRPHTLYVFGAGTGVGKTESTKEIVSHLMREHDEQVGVIYLEEQAYKTVRSFAGKSINKRLEDPPVNDKSDPEYELLRDYKEEEANDAIDDLVDLDRLIVVDTGGSKDIETVMQLIEELLAMGVSYIVVDNLTAIELRLGGGSKVEAIDDAMKKLGTFKDEKPVALFLLSHLTRPQQPRVPHEKGGEVFITDFRGSGSISFWANGVFGIERNTTAETEEEQRMTTYRCVKSRDNGLAGGKCIYATMNPRTGRLLQAGNHQAPAPRAPAEDKGAQTVNRQAEEF